ncbi:hypothetical protein IV203_021287 [Nitzschia inconspicua]|uniref:Uncharacterized protein n=1 Tax=Nitzschia inconspicua TaxID=303405 RepID=A0A9K3KGU8_9STRA|nr:hypothetical protein IV203_021287 [Nitzschia inconspicua]
MSTTFLESLSQDQLKQAFYDGMPAPWRERFIVAGLKFWEISTNEQQLAESAKSSKSNKFKTHKEKGNKTQKGRVADDDTCPVHPGSKHTWGQCNANRFNSTSDTSKGSKNKLKNKNQGKSKDQSKTNDPSDPSDGFSNDVIPDDFYSKGNTAHGCFVVEQMVNLDSYLIICNAKGKTIFRCRVKGITH